MRRVEPGRDGPQGGLRTGHVDGAAGSRPPPGQCRPARRGRADTCPRAPNDLFLLCSDGLTKVVPDPLLDALLADVRVPEPAAALLLARTLEGGAPDNVSVVTVAAA